MVGFCVSLRCIMLPYNGCSYISPRTTLLHDHAYDPCENGMILGVHVPAGIVLSQQWICFFVQVATLRAHRLRVVREMSSMNVVGVPSDAPSGSPMRYCRRLHTRPYNRTVDRGTTSCHAYPLALQNMVLQFFREHVNPRWCDQRD